jgi:hypothetical protein
MSRQITLEVPDDLMDRAEALAQYSRRNVDQVLLDTLDASLPSLPAPTDFSRMSDEEVLAASKPLPASEDNPRFSELLQEQQSRSLSGAEKAELAEFLRQYGVLWVRQSEALAEAVRRGLRPPLSS